MSLTIKELEIRMRVGDQSEEREPSSRTSGEAACIKKDRRQIVDDSVRRVLQALRNLEER